MEFPKPQKEHRWLEQLVGNWTFEHECDGPPGEPKMKSRGTQTNRMLGDTWLLCEGEGDGPGGGTNRMLMTLGFDSKKRCYVGSFISDCMHEMWIYEGSVDTSGKVLTLDTQGPAFHDPTKTAKYQDIFEIVGPDLYMLRSRVQGEDGAWTMFMEAPYHRAK